MRICFSESLPSPQNAPNWPAEPHGGSLWWTHWKWMWGASLGLPLVALDSLISDTMDVSLEPLPFRLLPSQDQFNLCPLLLLTNTISSARPTALLGCSRDLCQISACHHPLPASPGKSLVPCMYMGSYAEECNFQEPLPSLGNQPRAVPAASIPRYLRCVCSPSLGPSEMSSRYYFRESHPGKEACSTGFHVAFIEPTERDCCAQKLGLVKTLEPIKKSSPVHEKNLGFWHITDWPEICTTVWRTRKTKYFSQRRDEGMGTWEALFHRSQSFSSARWTVLEISCTTLHWELIVPCVH